MANTLKLTISNKIERIGFFVYYIAMMIWGSIIVLTSLRQGSIFIPFAFLGGVIAILAVIIIFSFFRKVTQVRYLLSAFIFILIIMFTGSAVCETIIYGFKLFPFIMKLFLYAFMTATAIKHLAILKHKLDLLDRIKDK